MPSYHKDFIEYKPETKQYFIINYTLREDLILKESLKNEQYEILDNTLYIPIKINYKLDYKNDQEIKNLLSKDHKNEIFVINEMQKNNVDMARDVKKDDIEQIKFNNTANFMYEYFKFIKIFNYNNMYEYIFENAKKGELNDEYFDPFFDNGSIIKGAIYGGISIKYLEEYFKFTRNYRNRFYIHEQFKIYRIYDFIKKYRPEIYDKIIKYYTS